MTENNFFGGIKLIKTDIYSDERGDFSELYNKEFLIKNGIDFDFIQDNLSSSLKENTLRGLHFQLSPFEQTKLVRVITGSILDVYIDLRHDSKTFEMCGSCNLTPNDGWLLVPKGFAHGFVTLSDNTKVFYKVDNYYNKDHEQGIRWDDPYFNIAWPKGNNFVLSEKDSNLPYWNEIKKEIKF